MTGNDPINAIRASLQLYFDGLYECNIEKLSQVFHPSAQYTCATDDDLVRLDMPTYFEIVSQRVSPASLNQPRYDKLISLTFAGDKTALAQVQCAIKPKFFTDFLSLILHNGRWQIIAKVFHYDIFKE